MSALMKTEAIKTRTGTAVRERGAARVDEIIQATKKILVNDGLANLSTRRVARELGISIGNLHYYFSTKNDLLQAVIEDVIRGYDEEFEREAKLFPNAPRKRIEAFLRYLIADAKKPEVRAFFYQLWGMSVQNEFAADLRDKAYNRFTDMMVDMLAPLHPERSSSESSSWNNRITESGCFNSSCQSHCGTSAGQTPSGWTPCHNGEPPPMLSMPPSPKRPEHSRCAQRRCVAGIEPSTGHQ